MLTKEFLDSLYYEEKGLKRAEAAIGYRKRRIKQLEEDIRRLEDRADVHSPITEDVPRGGGGANSKLDIIVPELVDKKDELERIRKRLHADKVNFVRKRIAYREKAADAEKALNSIRSERIKVALLYHYIDRLSWDKTADKLGGENTGDSLRKLCERYLDGNKGRKKYRRRKPHTGAEK